MTNWNEIQERGSSIGIYISFSFFKLFGNKLTKLFLYPIIFYFYKTDKLGKIALDEYFCQVNIKRQELNLKALNYNKWLNYRNFGFGVVDKLSALINKIPINSAQIEGHDLLDERIATGQGGVVIISHLGNFEIIRAVASISSKVKLNIIVDLNVSKKINSIAKIIKDNDNIKFIGTDSIDISLGIKLTEKVDNGEFIVIAGDRVAHNSNNNIKLKFLGKDANFPIAPYILSKILKVPLYSLFCIKNREVYTATFFEIAENVKFKTQLEIEQYAKVYVSSLENYSIKYPNQWYNIFSFWEQ